MEVNTRSPLGYKEQCMWVCVCAAVRANSHEMTHTLVSHGAWVEQLCQKRWTAMHEVAKVGNVDILMLLLRAGGRVNQKDVMGVTPLAVAAEHGHLHTTEILLNCGEFINSPPA